jgi:hypothetical protein
LEGDTIALRLCVDKLLPNARERPCSYKLPQLQTMSDAVTAVAAIASDLASGKLLPTEAESMSRVVTDFAKLIELSEVETRLVALEKSRDEAARDRTHYDA